MSEEQPFLPLAGHYSHSDTRTWREKAAEFFDSPRWHTAVIVLIAIDAACVLVDLSYTVLSDECGPSTKQPPWLQVLTNISLTINSFFVLEIPIAIDVVHAGLHFFDAVIIVTTFVLEVILRGAERNLAGLLVILRLWRFVELIGGVAVGAGEIEEGDARRLAEALDELERVRTELSVLKSENHDLRQRLTGLQQEVNFSRRSSTSLHSNTSEDS
ncbi:hypothetical protein FPV67DRAFT_1443548 [Lyophyllum atratum]|nr:hypothetical protein FPV67DRAFT_1443548 [Lyophyllum atratum]